MSLINPSALGLFSPGSLSKLSQSTNFSQIYQTPQNATKKLFSQEI
jgi:hypothetical protein